MRAPRAAAILGVVDMIRLEAHLVATRK